LAQLVKSPSGRKNIAPHWHHDQAGKHSFSAEKGCNWGFLQGIDLFCRTGNLAHLLFLFIQRYPPTAYSGNRQRLCAAGRMA
jgi:hypothetical protein